MIERHGPGYQEFFNTIKELQKMNNKRIRIGILNESLKNAEGITILEYAIYNEYGTRNMSARPFFREATERSDNEREIKDYIESQIEKIVNSKGRYSSTEALNSIGEYVRGKVIDSIKNGSWANNMPSTIKKKGRNTPLIDDGDLIRSIEFEVI